jgi:hypothetical protein
VTVETKADPFVLMALATRLHALSNSSKHEALAHEALACAIAKEVPPKKAV